MHRTATFFDLKITASGKSNVKGFETIFEATPKSLSEIYQFIEKLMASGDRLLQKGRTSKSARFYLADMKLQGSKLVLLVNRCDPTAPDAVSSDPENKSRVVHTKPEGHGGDFSAHVVIETTPIKGDNYYLCVIETVFGSGLHASSVAGYLRHVFRHCRLQFPSEFLIPHDSGAKQKDGSPVTVRHVHFAELQGHPSTEFEKELSEGTLSGLELLDFSTKGAVWDEQGVIEEQGRKVLLRPEKKVLKDTAKAVQQIRSKVLGDKNLHYPQIRIRFTNQKGEPRDATIDTESGRLVNEQKYVKRHVINAPTINTASLDAINGIIIKQVLRLMG